MVIVIVKKAEEERAQVVVEVESSYVDPFGIDRSQSQRSDDKLQALLADARRVARRRGTRWTTRMTRSTTMMAEVSEVGDTAAAAAGEGSARKGSSGGGSS
jgi:uncharacterized protein (DUF1697 family)